MAQPSPSLIKAISTVFLSTAVKHDSSQPMQPSIRTLYGALTAKIAFQSNREGSLDIFVIDAKGGAPTRLTTNSGSETPIAFADNDHVLYSASLQPTAQSIIFGDNTFPQVYKVSTKGGRPELFSTLTMEDISIAKNGDILYHDKRDTKTLGANTRNHLSLATSG